MARGPQPLTPVLVPSPTGVSIVPTMAHRSLRLMCRCSLARHVDLRVEGLDNVPAAGPVLIAARHFHHLYDGCAIGTAIPRPVHVLVAMDWVGPALGRRAFERACRAARFPVVIRPNAVAARPELRGEAARALRRAVADAVDLLRTGRVLLVFPEGYPNVDPGYTPKPDDATFLPFDPGFARLVALAQRGTGSRIPIVPAGLEYARGPRWRLTLRFGSPLFLEPGADRTGIVREVESAVRRLSELPGETVERNVVR